MRIAALGAVSAAVLLASVTGPTGASGPAAGHPTVVLVHGAFAESASWNGVVHELEKDGYRVVAAGNPLRGVRSDADHVASLLRSIPGPVVLVGHSYAGSVISEAAVDQANVKALVYVAAFAPDEGETAGGLGGRFPGSTIGPTLAPPVPLPDGSKDLYIKQDRFPQQFAADVPLAQAKEMAATQRPIAAAAFDEASGPAAWKRLPSWFIYGSLDKNIPAALQVFMAKRAHAREAVEIKGASHVVMISHPRAVAELIERAATAP